jgi:hypothetical protein
MSLKERLGLLVIVLVFLASGTYRFLREAPYFDVESVEMLQIRKMLDYGFFERQGIVMFPEVSFGKLAHPEKFNYTHHPFPRSWWYAGVCHFFGALGVAVFNVVAGLLACLLIYAALRRRFGFGPSLIPAALCACAPVLQYWAVGTTSTVLMILFWPVAALVIWPTNGQAQAATGRCLLLGLTVFLAGQVEWSTLATVLPLLLMSAIPGADWKETVRRNFRNRLWWAIILGAVLTALVFLAQVVICTPDLREPFQHARGLAWSNLAARQQGGSAHAKLFGISLLRTVFVVGPGLFAGLLLGVRAATRPNRFTPAAAGMIAYLLLFFLGMMLAPVFYNYETYLLIWLLFPAAFLTASWLSTTRIRAAAWGLVVLTIPGFLYVQATAAMPKVSRASQMLARYLAQHTNPEDLVLTDLKSQAFPFKYWDQYGVDRLADRLAFYDVTSLKQLDALREKFRGQVARTLYLHQSYVPIEGDLGQKLRAQGRLLDRAELPVPAEAETGDLPLLRPIYRWRHKAGLGTLGNGARTETNRVVILELYRLE